MVLAEPAKYLSSPGPAEQLINDGREGARVGLFHTDTGKAEMEQELDIEAARPPYIHAMLAGGLGGTTGDMLMHSLDTVKTRQQGDPHVPPKYTSMGRSYYTIFRQEGITRGLYSGVTPAFVGSFAGTTIFFGSYEWTKRRFLDMNMNPSIAYLSAGFIADLAASPIYVPSEVLKTRLQLQGRHNNPYFHSGYNYRSTLHAMRTIARTEGFAALFYGYKATLARDLPFSALQFAFYEQEQRLAKAWVGQRDIGLPLEIFTGASAGGMAGVLTCPLDVVKTRIQTQQNPALAPASSPPPPPPQAQRELKTKTTLASSAAAAPSPTSAKHATPASVGKAGAPLQPKRPISTSSPSTALRHHSAVTLDTSSVLTGLRLIYKTEGVAGWFRGVGPRAVWTSVQSGTMLVMYQALLRWFERHPIVEGEEV